MILFKWLNSLTILQFLQQQKMHDFFLYFHFLNFFTLFFSFQYATLFQSIQSLYGKCRRITYFIHHCIRNYWVTMEPNDAKKEREEWEGERKIKKCSLKKEMLEMIIEFFSCLRLMSVDFMEYSISMHPVHINRT